jgi:hypothetical protein
MHRTASELVLHQPSAEGSVWIQRHPELSRTYDAKWVVAVPNRVVAAGDDPEEVRREAADILGLSDEESHLVVVAWVCDPETWIYDD